jgi:hypothetical protein
VHGTPWFCLLTIARWYGWLPAGTAPPDDWESLVSEWDGRYFPSAQLITEEDAKAFAAALRRALPHVAIRSARRDAAGCNAPRVLACPAQGVLRAVAPDPASDSLYFSLRHIFAPEVYAARRVVPFLIPQIEVRAMFHAVHAAALRLSTPHQLASEIWSFAVGLRHRQVSERTSRPGRHLRDSVYLFYQARTSCRCGT